MVGVDGQEITIVPSFFCRCPPSIMMEPVMADLSEKYPETVFLKVDAEICTVMRNFFYLSGKGGEGCKQLMIITLFCIFFQQTAELYEIKGYPTFVFIKNKKQLQQVFFVHSAISNAYR